MLRHKGTKAIETDRLILRPFRTEDADDMFNNWANDPQVAKYLTWKAHTDIDVSISVLKAWVDAYNSPETYRWGICLKEHGDHVIGSIDVTGLDNDLERADIGYCISRKFWRQGIMSEALKAVLDYLFACGFTRITAYHDTNNPNSGRVMKKCGMQFEGISRSSDQTNDGVFCDCAHYAILKTDPR